MNPQARMLSFEDTETAFSYKSDAALKKAHFLFRMIGQPFMLKLGLAITPAAIRYRLPFTKTLIRNTLFSQFVGGETLEQTASVAKTLEKFQVQVILDYGVEGGQGEPAFEHATEEFIKVVQYAASRPNIPFMSIKVTGLASFALLEKIDSSMHKAHGTLIKRYEQAVDLLTAEEKESWEKVVERMVKICSIASGLHIGVLIDAEESWIQDPVDALTILMMDRFNKSEAVVFNTLQLYRHDRLAFLKESYEAAASRGFVLGAKLVRGAYMEKERERAGLMGYPSPIQPDKASSDRDYDAALEFCLQHIDQVSLIVASHNENSNLLTTQIMQQKGIPANHRHVHFSQLYGMSDHITFNLAHAGYSVSKYLPFGPIHDVVPYLMRRAQENSSVSGQTGRELGLLEKELQRRKQA